MRRNDTGRRHAASCVELRAGTQLPSQRRGTQLPIVNHQLELQPRTGPGNFAPVVETNTNLIKDMYPPITPKTMNVWTIKTFQRLWRNIGRKWRNGHGTHHPGKSLRWKTGRNLTKCVLPQRQPHLFAYSGQKPDTRMLKCLIVSDSQRVKVKDKNPDPKNSVIR